MSDICIVLPGEGSGYIGMGKSLYDNYPEVKKLFDIADNTLGYKLSDIIFYGSNEALSDQSVLQPAILTTSYAYYTVLKKQFDVSADYFLGYGLGEITALVCVGVINFRDAVDLVAKRGNILNQEFANQKMLNLQLTMDEGFDIFQWIECFGKDLDMTVTGYISTCCYQVCAPFKKKREILRLLKENQIEVEIMKGDLPLNCHKMQKASQKFQQVLWGLKISKKGKIKKVLSGIDGKEYKDQEDVVHNLTYGMYQPVRWDKMIQQISSDRKVKVIDIGPSSICGDWIKAVHSNNITIASLDLLDNSYYCLSIFQDKKLFNKKFLLGKMNAIAVSIENRCFDDNEYKTGVVTPYSKMKERYDDISKNKLDPKDQDIMDAKDDLILIMRTKGLNDDEIDWRLKRIEDETLVSLSYTERKRLFGIERKLL